MQMKTLTPALAVGPQVHGHDIEELAARGFRSIIGNRPDGEQPEQPRWSEIASAAAGQGMASRHIPVIPGAISDEAVEAFREAVRDLPRPIAAFCRTGTRSASLWALADVQSMTVNERICLAATHGFDLEPLRGRLEAKR